MSGEIVFALGTGLYVIGLGITYILYLKKEYSTRFTFDDLDDYSEIPEDYSGIPEKI